MNKEPAMVTERTDSLTPAQHARVDELKRERASLTNPFDRIAFDNVADTDSKEMVLRIIASLESTR